MSKSNIQLDTAKVLVNLRAQLAVVEKEVSDHTAACAAHAKAMVAWHKDLAKQVKAKITTVYSATAVSVDDCNDIPTGALRVVMNLPAGYTHPPTKPEMPKNWGDGFNGRPEHPHTRIPGLKKLIRTLELVTDTTVPASIAEELRYYL
jgi:hypothetical protein